MSLTRRCACTECTDQNPAGILFTAREYAAHDEQRQAAVAAALADLDSWNLDIPQRSSTPLPPGASPIFPDFGGGESDPEVDLHSDSEQDSESLADEAKSPVAWEEREDGSLGAGEGSDDDVGRVDDETTDRMLDDSDDDSRQEAVLGPHCVEQYTPTLQPYDPTARVRHPLAPPLEDDDSFAQQQHSVHDNVILRQVFLLVVIMRVIYRLPRRACDFLLLGIAVILRTLLAFRPVDESDEDVASAALDALPRDSRTVIKRFGLSTSFLRYPLCPNVLCRTLYPYDTRTHPLPSNCTAERSAGRWCGEPLVDDAHKPLAVLVVRPILDFVRALFMRRDLAPHLWPAALDKASPDVVLRDGVDGRIFRTLPSAPHQGSGKPFYSSGGRLSLSVYYDGVNLTRGVTGNSYSIGVLTLAVNNLPLHLRFRKENVGLISVLNGPKEFPSASFHQVLQIVVEALKDLWEGVNIPNILTPCQPTSPASPSVQLDPPQNLVFAALHAVLGDRPAQTKLLGTTGHMASSFCPLDDASFAAKSPKVAIRRRANATKAFDLSLLHARSNEEQRAAMVEWQVAPAKERKEIELLKGVKSTPLAQLPNFDVVLGGAFDAAHAALLGCAKWQHYQLNTQTSLFDEQLHSFPYLRHILSHIIVPHDVGRLPTGFGTAGASSVKADGWRSWTEFLSTISLYTMLHEPPTADELEQLKRDVAKLVDKSKKRKKRARTGGEPADETLPHGLDGKASSNADSTRSAFNKHWQSRLSEASEEERRAVQLASFDAWLSFVRGVRLAFRHTISPARADAADAAFAAYAQQLRALFGDGALAPNHHYMLHVGVMLKLYGPIYGTWTMAHERLNGIISSANINNKPGELEATLMANHADEAATSAFGAQSEVPNDDGSFSAGEREILRELGRSRMDRRGTVAEADLPSASPLSVSAPSLGPPASSVHLDRQTYAHFLAFLNTPSSPTSHYGRFVSETTPRVGEHDIPVSSVLRCSAFAQVQSFRISPPPPVLKKHDSSFVLVRRLDGTSSIARIVHLFRVKAIAASSLELNASLAYVRWCKPAALDWPSAEAARALAEMPDLGFHVVLCDDYEADSPEDFIELHRVRARAAYFDGRVGGQKVRMIQTIERD